MEFELVPKIEPEKVASETSQDDGPLIYKGPDRRKGPRRITVDRREMVRFQDKPDRRKGNDRRGDLKLWDGRNF